jgi:hypothetical protein
MLAVAALVLPSFNLGIIDRNYIVRRIKNTSVRLIPRYKASNGLWVKL